MARRNSDSPTTLAHTPVSITSTNTLPISPQGRILHPNSVSDTPSPRTNPTFPGVSTGLSSHDARHYASQLRHSLGKNWYFKGMEILSKSGLEWISTKTGQPGPLGRFDLLGAHAGPTCLNHSIAQFSALPEQDHVTSVFQAFSDSFLPATSAVPDPKTFHTAVTEAYNATDHLRSGSQSPAQAYIWASLAFMSSQNCIRKLNSPPNGQHCADMADLALGLLTSTLTLQGLEAILMLVRPSLSSSSRALFLTLWNSNYTE